MNVLWSSNQLERQLTLTDALCFADTCGSNGGGQAGLCSRNGFAGNLDDTVDYVIDFGIIFF